MCCLSKVLAGEDPVFVVESIVTEAKLDKLTKDISNYIVSMLKKHPTTDRFRRKIGSVMLVCHIDKRPGYYAINVSGTHERRDNQSWITVTIQLPFEFPVNRRTNPSGKGWKPPSWENLIGEIRQTVRHELEHSSQDSMPGENPDLASTHGLIKYYTNKREIAAYVSGLYKTAKSKRVPFVYLVNDYMDGIKDQIIQSLGDPRSINKDWVKKEVIKIRDLWLDYAKKRYPKAAGIGDTPLLPKKYVSARKKYSRRKNR